MLLVQTFLLFPLDKSILSPKAGWQSDFASFVVNNYVLLTRRFLASLRLWFHKMDGTGWPYHAFGWKFDFH